MKIPFSKPDITTDEILLAMRTLESGWITVGPQVKKFEERLGRYIGTENVVAVDSCTSALTLSAVAIRSQEYEMRSSIALIPALTFVATANSFYHAGYDVQFCDVGMDGNMCEDQIGVDSEVTVPVHFAGQVCDLKRIREKSFVVIEDAAHAIGAKYDGVSVGLSKYSEGACFSFYPTKNMTTIEGGAFVSREKLLVDNVRKLSLHGLDSSHIDRYERSSTARPTVDYPGFKANMTDVEASIGIVQLQRLPSFIERRKQLAKNYMEELSGKVRMLDLNGRDHVWHMFIILINGRDEFLDDLKKEEIFAGVHYSPIIPAHPFYRDLTDYKVGKFPNAEYIADHCISLPLYNGMTDIEQSYVIEKVKKLL
jgi:perosamine synthetase